MLLLFVWARSLNYACLNPYACYSPITCSITPLMSLTHIAASHSCELFPHPLAHMNCMLLHRLMPFPSLGNSGQWQGLWYMMSDFCQDADKTRWPPFIRTHNPANWEKKPLLSWHPRSCWYWLTNTTNVHSLAWHVCLPQFVHRGLWQPYFFEVIYLTNYMLISFQYVGVCW